MADPSKIGKYEVLERIGRGGMGFVYRAIDPLLKREVALKTMLKDLSGDEELRTRFSREAQSAGGLHHPNIVTIYDLGEDDDHCPYIAMEFLTGTDIEHVIKNKTTLPLLKKLDIIIQTCQGLSYAHSKGIIHRDIKPANIRLLDNGEVKIMDFGIAKIAASHFTRTGMIMGTPHYMAPEQIRGEKVDGRADIFSLGVVLFELIVFRKPFPGDNPTAVLFKIIHAEPDRLTDAKFSPPEGLEEIVSRALAKKPETRYQTCDEMLADLMDVFEKVKQTETIEPTFIIEKPYATITVNKTPLPRKVTPLPRPSPVYTPPLSSPKINGPAAGAVTPSQISQTPKTESNGAASASALQQPVAPLKAEPARDLPPISPTPVPSEARKWVLVASSGVLGIALISVLLLGLVRKLAMPELTFPKLRTKAARSAPAALAPKQQPASITPVKPPEVTTPPKEGTGTVTPVDKQQEATAVPQTDGWVALNIQPWAEIKEIKNEKGVSVPMACSVTPCKMALPAGTYDISLYNSQFQNTIVHVEVRSNETTLVNQKMEGFDYAKAVDSLGF